MLKKRSETTLSTNLINESDSVKKEVFLYFECRGKIDLKNGGLAYLKSASKQLLEYKKSRLLELQTSN